MGCTALLLKHLQEAANDVVRVARGHGLHEAGEVHVGGVVGAVGDGAHCAEGDTIIRADLGDRGAFHLDGQHVVVRSAQGIAQDFGARRSGHEQVAAGDEAGVAAGCASGAFHGACLRAQILQAAVHRRREQAGQVRVARQPGAAVAGQFPAREQRRCVHVVLQVVVRDHHVAHLHAVPQAARHAREHDARGAEAFDERRGGGGRRHLADAGQGQHHVLPFQRAAEERPAGVHDTFRRLQGKREAGLLFGQGAEDGGSEHGGKAGGTSPPAAGRVARQAFLLSRSSRRRILPTGVLGSDSRNSITRGCL